MLIVSMVYCSVGAVIGLLYLIDIKYHRMKGDRSSITFEELESYPLFVVGWPLYLFILFLAMLFHLPSLVEAKLGALKTRAKETIVPKINEKLESLILFFVGGK